MLAKDPGTVDSLVVDDHAVYWTSTLLESSLHMVEPGKAAVTLPKPSPKIIIGDDANLYWSADGVIQFKKSTKTATKIAPSGGSPMAIDASGLYWASTDGVYRLPTGWTKPALIAPSLPGLVVKAMVTTPDAVFTLGYHLDRIDKATNQVTPLADGTGEVLATDGTDLFFTEGTSVWRSNTKTGGKVQVGPEPVCSHIEAMAVDSTNLYLACVVLRRNHTNTDGSIVVLPKTGGCPRILATGIDWPKAILVRNGSVYWGGNDGIRRLTP